MDPLKTFALFALTALAEIVGCYLPYLLKQGRSAWLLVPAGASLVLFASSRCIPLLPAASTRLTAAYTSALS